MIGGGYVSIGIGLLFVVDVLLDRFCREVLFIGVCVWIPVAFMWVFHEGRTRVEEGVVSLGSFQCSV